VQKCAALCCIYVTYARLTDTQTLGINFATVRKVDFSVKVIECPIPPLPVPTLLWHRFNYLVYFEKINKHFNISSHNFG